MNFSFGTKIFATVLAASSLAMPLSVSAAPLPGFFHTHPCTPDARIRFTVYNQAFMHYQVRIAGRVYAVEPHRSITVTAPTGTEVYAATDMHSVKNGSLLFEIKPGDESHRLIIE